MGNIDFIFTFLEKERNTFLDKLALLKKRPEKEAVHDLRVSVKKIRAALHLYEQITEKKFADNCLQETEQLFGILGKQRDVEICLEIILALQKETGKRYPELRRYFRSVLPVTYQWTRKATRQYNGNELEEIALSVKEGTPEIAGYELKQKISAIINTRLVGCRNFFKKPHKLRQRLKELYYWVKMIPKTLYSAAGYEKNLNKLLDDYGNWQNFTVLEMKLKHFIKDFLPKAFPEYGAVKMLENEVRKKKEKLLKSTLRRTHSLLKKATTPVRKKRVEIKTGFTGVTTGE